MPTPARSRRKRAKGQLKAWALTDMAHLELLSGQRVFGYALWRQDWVKVSSYLTHGRRAYGASIRDVIDSINYAGSPHPRRRPPYASKQGIMVREPRLRRVYELKQPGLVRPSLV